jgi:hypothetical protein
MREIVNGIFYVEPAVRGVCCRATCRRGARSIAGSRHSATRGRFEKINQLLVMADRERVGREASPTSQFAGQVKMKAAMCS